MKHIEVALKSIRLFVTLVIAITSSCGYCDEIKMPARFQTPEAREWLEEHLGKVVLANELSGVKGRFSEWAGFIDGKLVIADAGYEFDNPGDGVLYIGDETTSRGRRFLAPTRTGPITIVGERNAILELKAVSNPSEEQNTTTYRKLYFSLRSMQFLSN